MSNKNIIYIFILVLCLGTAGYFLVNNGSISNPIDVLTSQNVQATEKYSNLQIIDTQFLSNDKFKALKEIIFPDLIKLNKGNPNPFGEKKKKEEKTAK